MAHMAIELFWGYGWARLTFKSASQLLPVLWVMVLGFEDLTDRGLSYHFHDQSSSNSSFLTFLVYLCCFVLF